MTKKRDDQLPPVDRFPLAWPATYARTPREQRRTGPFKNARGPLELDQAVRRVSSELDLLKGADPVLSTNVPLGIAGLKGTTPVGGDPGVAVYFRHRDKPIVFACDTYTTVVQNIAAIAAHIEALRAIERFGVGRLEQVLVGFQRQLTGRRSWWDVLEVRADASLDVVEKNYTRLAKDYHPDKPTGSHEKMTELNEAYQLARAELENRRT